MDQNVIPQRLGAREKTRIEKDAGRHSLMRVCMGNHIGIFEKFLNCQLFTVLLDDQLRRGSVVIPGASHYIFDDVRRNRREVRSIYYKGEVADECLAVLTAHLVLRSVNGIKKHLPLA